MNKVQTLLGAVLLSAATTVSALDALFVPTLSVNFRDQAAGILSGRAIQLPLCQNVARNQPVTFYFNLAKAAVKDGKSSVSGTMTAISPNGKRTAVFTDKVLLEGELKNPGLVHTSPVEVTLRFGSNDPVGRYTWELTLKDNNSGEVCHAKPVSIDLEQSAANSMPMGDKEWETFLTAYYLHPAPRRIMAALDHFLTVKDAEYKRKNKNYNPLIPLSGFAQLFRLNPQLWPLLAQYSKTLTREQCKYLALLVNGIGSDAVEAMRNELPAEALKLITQLNHRNPLYAGNPTKLYHLDMLWIEFCITGRKAPIVKLLNEMRKREIMTLEQVKAKAEKKEKLTPAEQKKLGNYLMSLGAYRIIATAGKRGHRLPGYYIEAMVMRKELDPTVAVLAVKALRQGSETKKIQNNNKTTK